MQFLLSLAQRYFLQVDTVDADFAFYEQPGLDPELEISLRTQRTDVEEGKCLFDY